MRILACVIGVAVGLAVAYSQVKQPARASVPLSLRTPQAAAYATGGGNPGAAENLFPVEVDNVTFKGAKYASPIPCWYIGGKMVDISGNVSKINGD